MRRLFWFVRLPTPVRYLARFAALPSPVRKKILPHRSRKSPSNRSLPLARSLSTVRSCPSPCASATASRARGRPGPGAANDVAEAEKVAGDRWFLRRSRGARCSQAGSGRRSIGDGVAEAEKVGQEGKKAAGGGGVPCGGAATGQHLLESYLRPWLRTLSISVAAAELDLALPARWAGPMARRARYVRAAPPLRLAGLRVGADAEVSLLGRRIHKDAFVAAGRG